MRTIRFSLMAATGLMLAGTAMGSTVVGLVAAGRVVEVGSYDAGSEVLNVTVEFYGVDEERSATVYFGESFLEYRSAESEEIAMEGVSPEDALSIEAGTLLYVDYFNASGFNEDDKGVVGGWSETRWTFLELIPAS